MPRPPRNASPLVRTYLTRAGELVTSAQIAEQSRRFAADPSYVLAFDMGGLKEVFPAPPDPPPKSTKRKATEAPRAEALAGLGSCSATAKPPAKQKPTKSPPAAPSPARAALTQVDPNVPSSSAASTTPTPPSQPLDASPPSSGPSDEPNNASSEINSATPAKKRARKSPITALPSATPRLSVSPDGTRPLPTRGSSDQQTALDRFIALARFRGRRRRWARGLDSALLEAAGRAADNYIKNQDKEALLKWLELWKLWLVPAAAARTLKAGRAILNKFLREDIPLPQEADPTPTSRSRAQETERLVKAGRLGAAAKHLTTDDQVVTIEGPVLDELLRKHPAGPLAPCGTKLGPDPGRGPSKDVILAALDKFDPDSGVGNSGWTFRALKFVCQHPQVLEFMHMYTCQVMQGTAPGRDMMCVGKLTAITKKLGGYRPISVHESMYRLVMACLLEAKFEPDSLLPGQLGVKSPGGIDPLARAFELGSVNKLDRDYSHVASLDGVNAFNEGGRDLMDAAIHQFAPRLWRTYKWAYGSPSDLIAGNHVFLSRQGVRQGDNLGPYFWSLGYRPTMEALQQHLGPTRKVVSYLDDTYAFSTDDRVLHDCFEFFEKNNTMMKLNPTKCELVSLEEVRTNGYEVLGTCVGGIEGRRRFLRRKVAEARAKLARLREVNHQTALLLLRKCISVDLRHLQRCLETEDMRTEWRDLDAALWDEVKRLQNLQSTDDADGLLADILGQRLSSLPAKLGGLGILSHHDVAPHARAAALQAADSMVSKIFGLTRDEEQEVRSQRDRCGEMWDDQREAIFREVGPEKAAVLMENSSTIGRKWLNTIPYLPILEIADPTIEIALRTRTLAPPARPICRCGKASELLHEEVCAHSTFTARHNGIRDALATCFRRAWSMEVVLKPAAKFDGRRNNIGTRGPGRTGRTNTDYDVKVYSTANQKGKRIFQKPFDATSAVDQTRARFDDWFTTINDKANHNAPASVGVFTPLAFSSGGHMSKVTRSEMVSWRKEVGDGVSHALETISIRLLQARAMIYWSCTLTTDRLLRNRRMNEE